MVFLLLKKHDVENRCHVVLACVIRLATFFIFVVVNKSHGCIKTNNSLARLSTLNVFLPRSAALSRPRAHSLPLKMSKRMNTLISDKGSVISWNSWALKQTQKGVNSAFWRLFSGSFDALASVYESNTDSKQTALLVVNAVNTNKYITRCNALVYT